MHFVDLTASKRLPIQMELLSASSRMTNPAEVLDLFLSALRRVYRPRSYVLLSRRGLAPGEYRIAVMMDPQGCHLLDADEPWEGRGLPVHHGGIIGRLISDPRPRLVDHFNARGDPVVGALWGDYHSLMAVPIYDRGQPLNWLIVLDRAVNGCRVEELEELNLRANLAGEVINHLMTAHALRAAQALVRDEVARVAAIQRALLPRDVPDIPGARLAACHETFDQAGGDLYDVWPVIAPAGKGAESTPWAIMIADASGHGPSATVVGAMLHSILRTYPTAPAPASVPVSVPASLPVSAGDMLTYANQHLCEQKLGWSFVTAFLALYHPAEQILCYARAGHHPPLLRAAAGEIRRLEDVGDLPLGVSPQTRYNHRVLRLRPGQSVLMYTDGVCEAHDSEGEMLGIAGIERAVSRCDGEPQCIIDTVLSAVRQHERGCRPHDDQTLLALQAVE